MPLKLSLKPHEKVIIGNAVIQNLARGATFLVLNTTTILREKDILTQETANTPAKRIYLVIQLMYMTGSLEESRQHHPDYFRLTREFLDACPTPQAFELISIMGEQIINNNFYAALKTCKELVAYEKAILEGFAPEAAPAPPVEPSPPPAEQATPPAAQTEPSGSDK